jgi:hypothetical protein
MPLARTASNALRHRAISASFVTHRAARQNEPPFNVVDLDFKRPAQVEFHLSGQ